MGWLMESQRSGAWAVEMRGVFPPGRSGPASSTLSSTPGISRPLS